MESGPEVNSGSSTERQYKQSVALRELFGGVETVKANPTANPNILSVACDSRQVTQGALFFALPGHKANGNEFVIDAIKRGAVAVASPAPRPAEIQPGIDWIEIVPGTERRALALAAANFYGHPANALKLVGVTGTNGKTTTTFLIDSILHAAGFTTGRIGTTGYETPRGSRKAVNTTPESLDLQQMFAEVRDSGGTHAVLEVSSHALAMERVWGCHFAVAVFTNLTRDHLNFHKTFEEYFAAKRRLFEGMGAGAPDVAVVNADDPYSPRLEGLAKRTLTYGLNETAQLTTKTFSLRFDGTQFTAQTPAGKVEVRSSLVGRINVYNILRNELCPKIFHSFAAPCAH